MQIIKKLSKLFICICCTCFLCISCFAANNVPSGEISDYGSWLNEYNMGEFNTNITNDANSFTEKFESHLNQTNFVPLEAKLGLMFMRAMYALDYVLQSSLVRFAILFLFIMYAFWIAIEAYKMIREASDYKTVLYNIFKQGFIIAIWAFILAYGPAKIFSLIISPILELGTYISTFILNAVAQTYDVDIPDTCAAIHNYVNANNTGKLLVDSNTAANIMCLPGRISMYFWHAELTAIKWIIHGFGHSLTEIIVGIICVILFFKCMLKYAFMTLGVVADLFFTLLMLPFTALAEAMPSTSEKNYFGTVFSGFLKIFSTKKASAVISTFINAALYFVSLSIIIAICGALLTAVISTKSSPSFNIGVAMTTILTGYIVFHLAGQADKMAEDIGGEKNNSFGEMLYNDTSKLWKGTKDLGAKIFSAWANKK